jgi:hypothetical protein
MTALTEGKYPGEFIDSEANGTRSRDEGTILSGENVVAGQVLGLDTKGAATAGAVIGTGDGAMGEITVSAGAKVGAYRLTFIEPGTNVGDFIVEDPDGINVGAGAVAAAFVGGGLAFTLADGDNDFIAGDQIVITVAAGSGKYVAYDQDGVTGSEVAAGVAYGNYDATSADVAGVIVVRDAELNGNELTWPSDITAGEKLIAIAQLKALGLLVRT